MLRRVSLRLRMQVRPGSAPDGCRIDYETTEKSSALQWLTPEQTVGKRHPYLFSQCQAIHARTMVPCQDTPAVKAPYRAKVTVPRGLAVVMSANKRRQVASEEDDSETFEFDQTQPIPVPARPLRPIASLREHSRT